MMSMTFYVSSRVMLLFDFWESHGPVEMLLSVLVVVLMTVLYELFKVWRVWLETKSEQPQPHLKYTHRPHVRSDSTAGLDSSQSEISLTPGEPGPAVNIINSWVLHVIQTFLHLLQVTLGYMLMLSVMTYNTWIFLAVIVGSGIGYFISYPLLNRS